MALKNGGMVRGTIGELQPGQSVEIRLMDGSTRRFSMDEVSYAGPDSRMPSSITPGSEPTTASFTQQGPAARLRLFSSQPGVRFHRRMRTAQAGATGSGGGFAASEYMDLCSAPCEVTLPAGGYALALSSGGGGALDASPVDVPAGQSVVEGTYVSHAAIRTAGGTALLSGLVGGPILVLHGILGHSKRVCDTDVCVDQREPDVTEIAIGSAIFVGGFVLGVLGLAQGDEARLRIVPLRPLTRSLSIRGEGLAAAAGVGTAWSW